MDAETNGCIFQWKIQNTSHCWWTRKGLRIESPTFIADALEGTKWSLWLYPLEDDDENYLGLYLYRQKDCRGPDVIQVNYQLALLGNDGSILKEKTSPKRSFTKDCNWGYSKYETRENVFVTKRETFLPEDILTIQCTIRNNDETSVPKKRLYIRSVYRVNKGSFVWKIDKFGSYKSTLRNKFKCNLIDFDLALKEELDFETILIININSFDENIKIFSIKTSIVDSEGKQENYGSHEYFADDLKSGVLSIRLSTKSLMENKSRYLPNDVLSLDCEYSILTRTNFHEFVRSEIAAKLTNENVESRNEDYVGYLKSQNPSVLADDIKFMYNDAILCDVEFRTSTHSFPAHKAILSARSPVFSRMFSNDMKERNSGHVDIMDFEEDTVRRMLLYIYTDSLEDLHLESASNLYAVADKYEILSLKSRCSCFIKDNLCPTNVCSILVLADLHQDHNLKCFVKDYILKHDKAVFGSQEWKEFIDTYPKLAANAMYRKIYPG